jgi:ribonuclease-3
LVEATGPAHARHFSAVVIIDGDVLGEGEGVSRRAAEQAAARRALAAIDAGTKA